MISVLGIVFDSQFIRVTAIAIQYAEPAMLRIHSHKAAVFPIGRAIANDTKDAAIAPNRRERKGLTRSFRILRPASQGVIQSGLTNSFRESRIGRGRISGKEIEAGGELLRGAGSDFKGALD